MPEALPRVSIFAPPRVDNIHLPACHTAMLRLLASCLLLLLVRRAGAAAEGDAARMPRGAELAQTAPPLSFLTQQPSLSNTPGLCRSLSVFNDMLALAAAAGLVDVSGRTVFAPSDAAFRSDVFERLAISRDRLLASDAAVLAQIVQNHVTAASGAPVTTRSVDVAWGTLGLRTAAPEHPTLTLTRQQRTRQEVRYQPSPVIGDPPVATFVDVPYLVYVVNPGVSDADITAPNQSCRWERGPIHSAAVVHVIDSVLLTPSAAALARAGSFQVGRASVSVPRLSPAAALELQLYYPVSPARHPPLVFAHGMLAPVAVYSNTLAYLASHGFVVAAVRSGLGIVCPGCTFVEVDSFVQDVADAAAWLHAAGSPGGGVATPTVLLGRVDSSWGVGLMGHSMGGGAIFAAAKRGRAGVRISALLALAPSNGDFCGFEGGPERPCPAAASVASLPPGIAISVVAGDRDGNIPIQSNALSIFAAAHSPALLSVLRRGTHCFTEYPGNLGASQCGVQPYGGDTPSSGWEVNLNATKVTRDITVRSERAWQTTAVGQEVQLIAARRHAAAFFSAQLKGGPEARGLVWQGREWLFTDGLMSLLAAK